MLWYEAWYTANTRKGYHGDAAKDEQRMKEHFINLDKGDKVSKALVKNVEEMGWGSARNSAWGSAWYARNAIVGYKYDAVHDKAKLEVYFSKVQGPLNLVAMKFHRGRSQDPVAEAENSCSGETDQQQ